MNKPQLLTDLPIPLPVAGHHQAAPFYVTRDMFGGIPVAIAGGELSDKIGIPVARPHRHDVPEIYFLVSPTPGGARIRVVVDGEDHEMASPAVFYVPAGAEHCFLTLAAERGSYCFGILVGAPA
jgi:hypothetical protein